MLSVENLKCDLDKIVSKLVMGISKSLQCVPPISLGWHQPLVDMDEVLEAPGHAVTQ